MSSHKSNDVRRLVLWSNSVFELFKSRWRVLLRLRSRINSESSWLDVRPQFHATQSFLHAYHLAVYRDLKRFLLLLWWYAGWCCNKVTFVQVHLTALCKCSRLQDKAMKTCLCSNICFPFVRKFSSENSTSSVTDQGALLLVLWWTDCKWKTTSV